MKTQEALHNAIQNLPDTFSIQELAQLAQVSNPTARKFCKMQGFSTDHPGLYKKPQDFNPQNMEQENPKTSEKPPGNPLPSPIQQTIEASQDLYTLAYLKGFDRGFQQGFQTGFQLKETKK